MQFLWNQCERIVALYVHMHTFVPDVNLFRKKKNVVSWPEFYSPDFKTILMSVDAYMINCVLSSKFAKWHVIRLVESIKNHLEWLPFAFYRIWNAICIEINNEQNDMNNYYPTIVSHSIAHRAKQNVPVILSRFIITIIIIIIIHRWEIWIYFLLADPKTENNCHIWIWKHRHHHHVYVYHISFYVYSIVPGNGARLLFVAKILYFNRHKEYTFNFFTHSENDMYDDNNNNNDGGFKTLIFQTIESLVYDIIIQNRFEFGSFACNIYNVDWCARDMKEGGRWGQEKYVEIYRMCDFLLWDRHTEHVTILHMSV